MQDISANDHDEADAAAAADDGGGGGGGNANHV